MIIEIIGLFTLFYLIPAAVGLFLCRKWNTSPSSWCDKYDFIGFIVPIVNIAFLCMILCSLIEETETWKSIKSYFDGN